MGDREKTFFVIAAEIDEPAVIRTRIRSRELGISHPSFPENANGWVKESDINPFFVHHLHTSFGVITPWGTAIHVRLVAGDEELVGVHTNTTERAKRAADHFRHLIVKQ